VPEQRRKIGSQEPMTCCLLKTHYCTESLFTNPSLQPSFHTKNVLFLNALLSKCLKGNFKDFILVRRFRYHALWKRMMDGFKAKSVSVWTFDWTAARRAVITWALEPKKFIQGGSLRICHEFVARFVLLSLWMLLNDSRASHAS